MPTKKTIVYILATNYSGSHYLSLMLGSHSRAMHLGEIHRVRAVRDDAPICFACRDKPLCPILTGIPARHFERTYDIVFSRAGAEVQAVIDNSKMADGWVEHFLSDTSYQRKYIHLIRDPRALIRRWSLKPRSCKRELTRLWRLFREFPRRLLTNPIASFRDALTYQWLEQNRRITRLIEDHRLDATIVTYHDLAKDSEAEVQRLTEWIGLPFESRQLEYWNFEHHGTQKAEYEWIKEERTRHIDLRWQIDLAPSFQQRIIENPDVQAYLQHIDVEIGMDGLTRPAGAPSEIRRTPEVPGRITAAA